jgi:hypothetical protein
METENDSVIPPEVFWKRKTDWYITMWQYGKNDDSQFTTNLVRMGYPREEIINFIEVYNADPE